MHLKVTQFNKVKNVMRTYLNALQSFPGEKDRAMRRKWHKSTAGRVHRPRVGRAAVDDVPVCCGVWLATGLTSTYIYRVIHKSLRDFRTRLRNNQDRHGRKEHINR